jgi:hypothetical protein
LPTLARAGAFGVPLAVGAPPAAHALGGAGGGFAAPVLFAPLLPPSLGFAAPLPVAARGAPPPPSGVVARAVGIPASAAGPSEALVAFLRQRMGGAALPAAPAAAAAMPPPGAAPAAHAAPPPPSRAADAVTNLGGGLRARAAAEAAAATISDDEEAVTGGAPAAAAAAAGDADDADDDEVVFVPPPPPVVIDLLDDDEVEAPAAAAPAAAAAAAAVPCSQEDPSLCVVCFEPFTTGGAHRLVSLRCGHVFGRSCIAAWLESANRAQHACPVCKAAAAPADIRPLYVPPAGLHAVDTRELEAARREAAAARSALDAQSAQHAAAAAALAAQLADARTALAQVTQQATQQATQLQSLQVLQATQAAQQQRVAAAVTEGPAAAVQPPVPAAAAGRCPWGDYRCVEVVPTAGGVCCDLHDNVILLGCAPPAGADGVPPPLCLFRLDASRPALGARMSLRPGGGALRDVRLAPPAWLFRCTNGTRDGITFGGVGDPLALVLCARRLAVVACSAMVEVGALALPAEGCACAWGPPGSDEGACPPAFLSAMRFRSETRSVLFSQLRACCTHTCACIRAHCTRARMHPTARLRRRGGGRAGGRGWGVGRARVVSSRPLVAASGLRCRGRARAWRASRSPPRFLPLARSCAGRARRRHPATGGAHAAPLGAGRATSNARLHIA